jgi:spermidine synthase
VIEISPEVVEASSFFADDNHHALADPRTRLIVSDGRSHLQLTADRYDVIISEPSNPWMAGVAPLFTQEFFLAARSRLAPGGIICQWAHTYDMADADLRSIAATFSSVFPNGTMWLVGEGDALFIATNDASGLQLDNIARAWPRPGVEADLATASVFDVFSLLSLYVAGPSELQRYGQGAVIQTDDRMGLEFSGPLAVYWRGAEGNAAALRALVDRERAPAAVGASIAAAGAIEWRHRGQMLLKAHAYSAAYDDFARSVPLDQGDEAALAGLVDAAGAAKRLPEARHVLESLASAPHARSPVRVALARLLAAMGALDEAVVRAQEVVAAEPDDPRGLELLASIVADAGDLDRLRPLAVRMRQSHPEREETWYYAAMSSFLGGNLPEAIALAQRVVEMNPRHGLAYNLIGSANASLGQRDRAQQAFNASLEASPREASTYANLGRLNLESRNWDAAVKYFAQSLTLDPTDESVRATLSAVLVAQRRP